MWARFINIALGIWLMAAPDVLHYVGLEANNDRIIGPVVATFACCAIWDVLRPLRRVNTVLGAWLVIAPFILGYDELAPKINTVIVGLLIFGLSFVRGKTTHRFGGGWASLWRGDTTGQAT